MGILKTFNNGQVIALATQKQIKDISHMDSKILHNLDFKENKKSLGLVNLFENMGIIKVPFMKEMMQNCDYLYVNGREGAFTYDLLMDAEYPTVIQNIENDEYLGIDGVPFKMKTSHPFRQGDILSYDQDGVQVYVLPDSEVVDEGDGFVHEVAVSSKDPNAYFPASKLAAGTRIYKIGNALPEYGLNEWSGITGSGTPSKVTMEFRIGSPQGVQVSYTDYGCSVSLEGKENSYITDHLLRTAETYGGMTETKAEDKYLVIGKLNKEGKLTSQGIQKVDKLMNALAMAELYKMTATRMMFAQANIITGNGGSSARVNEGIYPQLRRGHRFTYRNEVELRAMLMQAADVIYAKTNIGIEYRKLKFKAGRRAFDLVRQMFKTEFQNTFTTFLDQSAVPVPLLQGKDRHNLDYQTFSIGKAFLEGIGNVEIEHDPSLDYDFGDVVVRGYTGGFSKRSWSLVMWDIADSQYSNALDPKVAPKGVTVDQKSMGKNMYIVKPDGVPEVSFGSETGRMSGSNVNSVFAHQGETFWCKSQMDAFILDLGRVVLIEREDAYTEDAIKYL